MRVSRPLDPLAWEGKKPEEAVMSETQSYKMCKHSRRQCLACPCGKGEYTFVNVVIAMAGAMLIAAPFMVWAWSL